MARITNFDHLAGSLTEVIKGADVFIGFSGPGTLTQDMGRTTFRNRMFSAPMGGTDIANDGCIGPKSTAFYELRGKGGAAAVTVSECMVHPAADAIRRHGGHSQPEAQSLRHVRRLLHDRQVQAEVSLPVGALRCRR